MSYSRSHVAFCSTVWLVIGLLISSSSLGCKADEASIEKGGAGESCTRRDDCSGSLLCIDNRCVAAAPIGDDKADGGMMVTDTRGQVGESCTRRADCRSMLACIDEVCVAEANLQAMPPSVRGERGETCQARNDCSDKLACVEGRCRENEYDLTVQAKDCFRVQCATTDDCCENFIPSTSCASWKASCDGGDTSFCSIYDAQCKCGQTCSDELCVFEDTCAVDLDCNSSALHCYDGKCAQCKVTGDCLDPEAVCTKGVCVTGCKQNEQCGLFEECQKGACVDVGCTSDRECFFSTHDPLSKCMDKQCVTPCTNDSECTAEFNVCQDGKCTFVGCESDAECRVLLGLSGSFTTDKAVCRAPTP